MAKPNKRKEEQFARYKTAYGNLTPAELESLWEYDENWCNSDEDAKEYLMNQLVTEDIDEKEVNDSFYKSPKVRKTLTKGELKKNTAAANAARTDRLSVLAQGLEAYKDLFGDLVEKTNTELKYVDSETGLPFTIKISKHKVQKVVTKVVKRKTKKNEAGEDVEVPFTTVELRAQAIEAVIRANGELFEAPSVCGTAFGFVTRDVKYPFGSIKMTHHKK